MSITTGISKYNFKNANFDKMNTVLQETDWDQVIGNEEDIEKANENFTKALINAT